MYKCILVNINKPNKPIKIIKPDIDCHDGNWVASFLECAALYYMVGWCLKTNLTG